jgi:2-amino-4-hydroxy-6-hydroxymethyldihydropteridine diphosphokinase
MNKVHVLIGGNMNDRAGNLARAVHFLGEHTGGMLRLSSVYETAPWGDTAQDRFLNQALILETALPPVILLDVLLSIELLMGRKRLAKNGPRIIDIDILFYNKLVYRDARLTIPHPEIQNRRFALIPLAEIDPDFIHPVLDLTMLQLLERCPDTLEVTRFKNTSNDISGKNNN